ncbi:hypothetical protein DICPUDRAFT_75441 [Dictyostelium purpureum]|uniref:Uncharacterized protein n=1 Tax=Dictyostelium purpureum TaxID=5786 RepID=F0ZAN6_DICPU|nr:uncharacterized protein DICPUDRAFT_75441 [Dictyostelium purpureum]EGC39031.1 hypothetical protein DICPUDRAFT_75441 [Dictyostelium purpureum]|eukprot:XP_003284484.1 hypothetical protein DICPUDRAFT_75441 [Dictyostelium purpureum]
MNELLSSLINLRVNEELKNSSNISDRLLYIVWNNIFLRNEIHKHILKFIKHSFVEFDKSRYDQFKDKSYITTLKWDGDLPDKNEFPPFLTDLYLCRFHKMLTPTTLPNTITTLTFGDKFNQVVPPGTLPNSIFIIRTQLLIFQTQFLDSDFAHYSNFKADTNAIPLPHHRYATACFYAEKLGIEIEFQRNGIWNIIPDPNPESDKDKDKDVYSNYDRIKKTFDNQSSKMASIIRKHTNSLLYNKVLSEDVGIGKKRLWRDYHKSWLHWMNGWVHIPPNVEATFWDAILSLLPNRISMVHRDSSYSADTRCILCSSADESIEHLVGGCTGMNKHGRIRRHDAVVTEISKSLIKHYEIPNVKNYSDPHITYSQSKDNEMTINIEIIRDICFKNSQSKISFIHPKFYIMFHFL